MRNLSGFSYEFIFADLLGARIEILLDEGWTSIHHIFGAGYRSKIRIHPDDLNILERAKKIVAENYFVLTFEGSQWVVPNAARESKLVLLTNGVFVDDDGVMVAKPFYPLTDEAGNRTPKSVFYEEVRSRKFVHSQYFLGDRNHPFYGEKYD